MDDVVTYGLTINTDAACAMRYKYALRRCGGLMIP